MQSASSLEKTLMLGKTEGRKRRGRQRMRWLYSITDSIDMNLSRLQEIVKDRGAWRVTVHGVAESDMSPLSLGTLYAFVAVNGGEPLLTSPLICFQASPNFSP